MRVDMLTLYAFSDKTHAKQRELWRGFLVLVMPVLIECEPSEFERMLETAQCRSMEQMVTALDEPKTVGELIWSVSAQFSEILGFEAELGLAAFLDVSVPTRLHSVGLASTQNKDNVIEGLWLKSFRDIQQRPEFHEITMEWKKAFDVFLEDEDAVLSADADDSEEAWADLNDEASEAIEPPASASLPPEKVDRRAHKRRKSG